MSLAAALWVAAQRPALKGIYHFSDAGVCSWYDFALAIGEEAHALGLLGKVAKVIPIRTQDYPTPAKRPPYSVLDKTLTWRDFELSPMHWRSQLRAVLTRLAVLK
jgi:dTDP-4-dehydrorhamnose reductase